MLRNGIGYVLPIVVIVIGIITLIFVAIGRVNQGVLLIAAPMTMIGLFLLAISYVIRKPNNKIKNKEE